MRRRSPIAVTAAVAAAAALALSGCGVPTGGPPIEIDVPRADGLGLPQQTEGPDARPSTSEPEESVRQFLTAAAGEPSTRDERLDVFLAKDQSVEWPEATESLRVVRLDGGQPEVVDLEQAEARVRVSGTLVGLYDQFGQLQPPSGKSSFTITYTLHRDADDRWLLVKPPAQYVLLDDVFETWYVQAPLYFLRTPDKSSLVPDVRYIFRSRNQDGMRADLVNWLLRGASEWLTPAVVSAFPVGTSVNRAPINVDGTVTVDLTSEAVEADPALMAAQLAWTLWGTGFRRLDVQVNGQSVESGALTDWTGRNPAALKSSDVPHWVNDGAIVPEYAPYTADVVRAGVRSASITHDQQLMAVVSQDDTLSIVAAIDPGDATPANEVVPVDLPPGRVGRPAWVGSDLVLVPVGGELYAVSITLDLHVSVQRESLATGVQRVASPPDGARVAMVIDGKAVVAPLVRHADGPTELGGQRRVGRQISGVTDVGWSQEDRLVVIGNGPEEGYIYEVAIDNAVVHELPNLAGAPKPSAVAVLCDSPADTRRRASAVYVTVDGRLFWVQSQYVDGVPYEGTKGPAASEPFV